MCVYFDKILFINGWVLGLAHGTAEEVVNECLLCLLIGVTYLCVTATSVGEEVRELVSEGLVDHTIHSSGHEVGPIASHWL